MARWHSWLGLIATFRQPSPYPPTLAYASCCNPHPGSILCFFLLVSVLGREPPLSGALLILIDMSLLITHPLSISLCLLHGPCVEKQVKGEERLIVPGGATGALVTGICGLSITLFAMIVALIPPPGTSDVWLHEAKVAGGSFLLVLSGLLIYWRARRKQLAMI